MDARLEKLRAQTYDIARQTFTDTAELHKYHRGVYQIMKKPSIIRQLDDETLLDILNFALCGIMEIIARLETQQQEAVN